MRKRTWLVAVSVLIALPIVRDLSRDRQSFAHSQTLKVADSGRAREIYQRDCLVCHGANGDGKTAILRDRDMSIPDWTDPKSLEGRVDQQLFNAIRFGRGKMPAERVGRANDEEVVGLIRYIRTIARDEARVTPTTESHASKR